MLDFLKAPQIWHKVVATVIVIVIVGPILYSTVPWLRNPKEQETAPKSSPDAGLSHEMVWLNSKKSRNVKIGNLRNLVF